MALPNFGQWTRRNLYLAAKSLATGFGATGAAAIFRQRAVDVSKEIQDTLIENAKAREERIKAEQEGSTVADQQEAEIRKIEADQKLAQRKALKKGNVAEAEGKGQQKVVAKAEEYEKKGVKEREGHGINVEQLKKTLESRKDLLERDQKKAEERQKGVITQEKILQTTQSIQSQTMPVQSRVAELQTQVQSDAQKISSQAADICKSYLQAMNKIQGKELEEHQSTSQAVVDSAKHTFAVDVLMTQTQLAVELAEYKSELEKVKASYETKVAKSVALHGNKLEQEAIKEIGNLKKEFDTKSAEIESKVRACQSKQSLFAKEIRGQIDIKELVQLSAYMKQMLTSESFDKMQGKREEAATVVSEHTISGTEKAANTFETQVKQDLAVAETLHSAQLKGNELSAKSFDGRMEKQVASDAIVGTHVSRGVENAHAARDIRVQSLGSLRGIDQAAEKDSIKGVQDLLNNMVSSNPGVADQILKGTKEEQAVIEEVEVHSKFKM